MSAPRARGRWIHGVAKVLSTTTSAPWRWATSATAAMSTMVSRGLVGVSTQTMRVRGRMTSPRVERSAASTSSPARR